MTRKRMIGMDRPVRIEWLDAAAAQLAAGASERDTRTHLWNLLEGVVAGDNPHTARGKTMTVISRVWITVPESNRDLRARALARIEGASPDERLALHWALLCAAYPFFFDAATTVGKLLQLHGSIALVQVLRRMTELWGDRSTVKPAIQRILRMMVSWNALSDAEEPGYLIGPKAPFKLSGTIQELLLESLLVTGQTLSFRDFRTVPALFPFDINLNLPELRHARQFEVHREGASEIVSLRV